MVWTTADIPDQTGKVAVVTGANGGLGLEVARELARKGGHVVMAARDHAKAETARGLIDNEIPDASLQLVALDLASLTSVHQAATQVLADHPHIDILVNNAGVMAIPERRTADGFEMQLAVNHLGHFALTAQLLAALLQSPRRPDGLGHQHRPARRPPPRPGQPPPARALRSLAGLRAVQAGQRPLRPRAGAAVPGRRSADQKHGGPPRVHQHRPAGAQRP
jgi:NAD(P)-dependent dehydrogenase (short-subunit alcohol dehydrogenase family)